MPVPRRLLELFPRPRCLTVLGGVGDLAGVGDLSLVVDVLDKDLLLVVDSLLSEARPAMTMDELPEVAALFLLLE